MVTVFLHIVGSPSCGAKN